MELINFDLNTSHVKVQLSKLNAPLSAPTWFKYISC